MKCIKCEGRGWTIRLHSDRTPKPAYWFNRGPEGERPAVCNCGTIEPQEADQ